MAGKNATFEQQASHSRATNNRVTAGETHVAGKQAIAEFNKPTEASNKMKQDHGSKEVKAERLRWQASEEQDHDSKWQANEEQDHGSKSQAREEQDHGSKWQASEKQDHDSKEGNVNGTRLQ